MIITISGMPGSGKSTIAKLIAKKLNLEHYSGGDYRREIAKERGITLAELNKLGEKEFWTDKQADEWQKNLGQTKDNFVIDSRLGFYFIPQSVKLFLSVEREVGARRILEEGRTQERFRNIGEAVKFWDQRVKSDLTRYQQYYNINPYDEKNYDLVLDTTELLIPEVEEKVMEFIRSRKKS